MSPGKWGPMIWTFFHALAEKIKEEHFNIEGRQLISFMIRICGILPCPECSQHATTFWKQVNVRRIRHKEDLMNILFIFHNIVNKRKNKQPFNKDNLSIYKQSNIINTYNNFVAVYQTKGNMKLIGDTFQRTLVLRDLKKWMINNHKCFY